jgi:hypothetical protein
MNKATERLIRSAICIPWQTAHELAEPDYWSGMMHHIDGAQSMLIAVDHSHPALEDLQFLWSIALHRRSMAYEER